MSKPPVFSRGPTALGKNDKRFEIGLPEQIHAELTALAVLKGQQPTEWARDLIIRTIRGELEMTRVLAGHPPRNTEQFR